MNKTIQKSEKKQVIVPVLALCTVALVMATTVGEVYAEAKPVDLEFVDTLKLTLAKYIQGSGSYIIDAMAIVVGGFMTAKTSSPAPLILSIVSALLFEICVKIFVT